MASHQLDVDLAPRLLDLVLDPHDPVVRRDRGDEHDDDEGGDHEDHDGDRAHAPLPPPEPPRSDQTNEGTRSTIPVRTSTRPGDAEHVEVALVDGHDPAALDADVETTDGEQGFHRPGVQHVVGDLGVVGLDPVPVVELDALQLDVLRAEELDRLVPEALGLDGHVGERGGQLLGVDRRTRRSSWSSSSRCSS